MQYRRFLRLLQLGGAESGNLDCNVKKTTLVFLPAIFVFRCGTYLLWQDGVLGRTGNCL